MVSESRINTVNESIGLIDVEDRVNSAMSATLAMRGVLEPSIYAAGTLSPMLKEEMSTNCYMVLHAEEMVRKAYDMFHAYMAQELAARKTARGQA